MRHAVTLRWIRRRGAADERGVIAIVTAIALTFLLVASALVLDFGLVRVDRQVNKSAADAATVAGLEGLSGSNGKAYPFRGVCTAIEFLQANNARFSAVTPASGVWTDGSGATRGNGCTDSGLRDQVCVPGDVSSWARFTWDGNWQGEPLQVIIQSGYDIATSGWAEETLPALQADNADGSQGCYQLAVVITQNRKPGLGSLATSSDLVSAIRTVGRVRPGPGGYAPAMLLLKRTGCPVLATGSNAGGSYIHVLGARSTNGATQPGTIHLDADGSTCTGGSNQSILLGKALNGIVAFAAPLPSGTGPDPSRPGQITTVAVTKGFAGTSSVVRDGSSYVYGSAALDALTAASAGKEPPTGRPLVTRKPVDDRYLTTIHAMVSAANANVFTTLTSANAGTRGYTVVSNCNPTGTLTGTSTAPNLFIDCTDNNGYKGTAILDAPTVVFNGRVNPSAAVSLPSATKVYVFGLPGKPAIEIGNAPAKYSMHTAGNLDLAGQCVGAPDSNALDKAVLFVRDGEIKQTGGELELCNTTVIMMGGHSSACLPAAGYVTAAAPSASPCVPPSGPAVTGSGQLTQTGGIVDWTAPNQYDVMTLPNGDPDPAKAAAWSDQNGPEDLAFWSESAGNASNPKYSMAGGGNLHVVGVYMVPNADPFIISGGAAQNLTNAQYITSSIELNGTNTNITMRVDPNAAVTLPKLQIVGLVR